MKLLVGLGNPGIKYQNNRHNIGHHFVDYLLSKLTGDELTGLNIKPVKSDVFMNLSGQFVQKILKKHQNFSLNDLYIAHDDLDIPLGKFKIDKGTGPKLHNGIKSIEETLKTKDFWRIRIGVDARISDSWIDGEKYVLSDFTQKEKILFNKIFIDILNKLTG
ncbi:MAG: aminoacyl-tRNA hydrolase [Patescibacteria group bacterium]